MPPNRGNQRGRTRYINFQKKRYWKDLDRLRNDGTLPDPPEVPWEKSGYTVTFYGWSYMDDDNAIARVKWILDWLVSRDYIVDDSRKHCRLLEVPEQVIDRQHKRVMLTLRRVE